MEKVQNHLYCIHANLCGCWRSGKWTSACFMHDKGNHAQVMYGDNNTTYVSVR